MTSKESMFFEQNQRPLPSLAEPPPVSIGGDSSESSAPQNASKLGQKSMKITSSSKFSDSEQEKGQPRMAYSSSQSKALSCVPEYSGKIPRSQIKRKYLINKTFVKLALRHKSAGTSAKLHKKYLKAGLKAKLTLVNNLFSLYQYLIPYTSKKKIFPLFVDSPIKHDIYSGGQPNAPAKIRAKSVQIIDHNLVDVSRYSNKVLAAASGSSVPTFNSLDTAVHSLFGINEYTLIRVTRSASDDTDGSIVLKLESAKPGDTSLIDSLEFSDEMMHSIGKPGETPSNLFIKKVVARPRYKSDMKVFLVSKHLHCSLYLDERMLERDLINGIINLNLDGSKPSMAGTDSTKGEPVDSVNPHIADAVDFNNNLISDFSHYGNPSESQTHDSKLTLHKPPDARAVYVTFPFDTCINEFDKLLKLSKSERHQSDSDMTSEKDSSPSSPRTDSSSSSIPLRTESSNSNSNSANSLTEISSGESGEKSQSSSSDVKVKLENGISSNNSASSSSSGSASGSVPPQPVQVTPNSTSRSLSSQGFGLNDIPDEMDAEMDDNGYNRPSLRRYLRFNKSDDQIRLPLPSSSADFQNQQENDRQRSNVSIHHHQQDQKTSQGNRELPSYMLQPHWPNNLPTMMPHGVVSQWRDQDKPQHESEEKESNA